jgi:poly-gamma-glutamate capsule biosynthesis protein CapA/YwtB (metallophosphatase superfamily)
MNYLFKISMLLVLQFACKSVGEDKSKNAIKIDSTISIIDSTKLSKEITARIHKDTLTFIGVGDMMLGTNYPSADFLPPENGKHLLSAVNHILQDATITFGNLEGVVLNEGGTVKKCSNSKLCYAFRMPEKLLDNLLTAGFDVMSIANNHVGDFGAEGRNNTIKALQKIGLPAAGLESVPSVIFEKEGIRYGFAGFAPNSGTMDIRNLVAAKKLVSELAEKCDIVMVSFHGGAEGTGHQHVTKKDEPFHGENRGNVYAFAHAVIDAGADVVFGHGPHVTRAVEVYKDRFIAYSLGNFCTYARFNLKGVSGVAPIIKVATDKEGKFLEGQITPIIQLGEGGVSLDDKKTAIHLIQQLTKTDFPTATIEVTEDGKIMYKK